MKTSLLLFSALLAPLACERPQLCSSGRAHANLTATFQAEKAPAKQPATPAAPAKKPAPKERDTRPNPPGHLFM